MRAPALPAASIDSDFRHCYSASRILVALAALVAMWAIPSEAASNAKTPPKTQAPAIHPDWDDRGIDATQPEWYRQHPFWKLISRSFRQQSDSIAARLQDSLPEHPDTIVDYYRGKMEQHPDTVPGKCLNFRTRGLIRKSTTSG